MRTSDAVIAGAGIIGLSAALELAGLGLKVTVLEQGVAMREASWAAAGMLAAGDPENPPLLRPLAEFSRSLYPDFLRGIEKLSGVSVPLRTSLTLQGEHARSPAYHALGVRELLRKQAPGLLPGTYAFLPLEEHSLDPRDLCRALPLAVRAAGVTLVENARVERVQLAGGRLRIETGKGVFSAPQFVHCCGAWPVASGAFSLPVEPRKGQILSVTMPPGAPRLGCVVRTPALYLVPRGDGRIVIGATVEREGFDRTVTDSATKALLAAAAGLWPPIRAGVVSERWTGLRPATQDALPIIDAAAQQAPGIFIATGHFRNGILLAPATARVLGQLLLGEAPSVDLRAFSAGRFSAVEAAS